MTGGIGGKKQFSLARWTKTDMHSVWVPAVCLFLDDMRGVDAFLFFVLVAGKAEKLVT